MLCPNFDEHLLGNHEDKVPESLSGRPSELPLPACIGGNDTSLADKADPPTGASKLVPDTTGLPY